jgi:hypothetical protein
MASYGDKLTPSKDSARPLSTALALGKIGTRRRQAVLDFLKANDDDPYLSLA